MTEPGKDYTLYADHVGCPEFLAYALEQGVFSRRQIRKIPFDHGDTPESYIKQYGREDLIESLKQNLLNPKPIPKSKSQSTYQGDFDSCPSCCP